MNVCKKVGYLVRNEKGTILKIYEGYRYIGFAAIPDVEKAIKFKNFVASIIEFEGLEEPNNSPIQGPVQKLSFSLNLYEPEKAIKP